MTLPNVWLCESQGEPMQFKSKMLLHSTTIYEKTFGVAIFYDFLILLKNRRKFYTPKKKNRRIPKSRKISNSRRILIKCRSSITNKIDYVILDKYYILKYTVISSYYLKY